MERRPSVPRPPAPEPTAPRPLPNSRDEEPAASVELVACAFCDAEVTEAFGRPGFWLCPACANECDAVSSWQGARPSTTCCSECGRSTDGDVRILAGPYVFACNLCVDASAMAPIEPGLDGACSFCGLRAVETPWLAVGRVFAICSHCAELGVIVLSEAALAAKSRLRVASGEPCSACGDRSAKSIESPRGLRVCRRCCFAGRFGRFCT
jgi:hypothetical protein